MLKYTTIDTSAQKEEVQNVDLFALYLKEKRLTETSAEQYYVMRFLKNLIYKAVIFCEIRNYVENVVIDTLD